MVDFIDEKGRRYSALTDYAVKHGVNGEKSLSGTLYGNESLMLQIDKGWRLEVNHEPYVVTFANPVDNGSRLTLEYDAVHAFFYEMDKSMVYSTLNGSNTAEAYLNHIFQGIDYDWRLEREVKAYSRENFGMKSRLNLFYDFINHTGLEFTVSGRNVRIIKEVGTDLSTIVKKGFNLKELRLEKNIGKFITYKRGYGGKIGPEPEEGQEDTRKSLVVEYESPLAEIYGRLEGEPVSDERYIIEENLLERVKGDVESSYEIAVQLEMEDLNRAGYTYDTPRAGDYILAINRDLNFERRVRIVSYESYYDVQGQLIEHKVSCNSIGTVERHASGAGLKHQLHHATQLAQEALDKAGEVSQQQYLMSASGKNTIYRYDDDPRNHGHRLYLNDLWFKPVGEEFVMYVWNGAEWEEIIRTGDNERVKQLVQEMEEYWRKADEAFEKQKAESERRLEEFNQSLEQFRQSLDENDVEADRKVNEFRKQLERDQQERERIREENQSKLGEFQQKLTEQSEERERIREQNDQKMSEFEKHLSDFEQQLKSFDAGMLEGLDQRIAEALDKADISQKINERVRSIINDAGFGNALQDIEDKLEQTSQTARVNAEIIGGDGKTRYNKNRTDTTNTTIQLETGYVEIGSNGPDGWPTDESGRLKELTISFEAECIPRGSSTVTVRLSTPLWYGAAIEMRPDSEYYPQADKKATAQATELFAVYNGQYTLAVDSPWFAEPTTQRVTIDSNKTVTVNPQLKTIADGNLEAEFHGEWSDNADIIFDGGS